MVNNEPLVLRFIEWRDYCDDYSIVTYWKLCPNPLDKVKRFDSKDECRKFAQSLGLEAEFVEEASDEH